MEVELGLLFLGLLIGELSFELEDKVCESDTLFIFAVASFKFNLV